MVSGSSLHIIRSAVAQCTWESVPAVGIRANGVL